LSETQVDTADRFRRVLCGVLAAVEGPDNTVLFVHQERGPFGGNWLLPGGGIELGESAEDAVIREVSEEAGIEITEPRLFAVYEITGEWNDHVYHFVLLGFKAKTTGVIPAEFKGHNVHGARLVRTGELPLHSTDLRILTDAGIAMFGEQEIEDALARDNIRMKSYRTQ
jgi:8-oxo-dGTP diphosphatase